MTHFDPAAAPAAGLATLSPQETARAVARGVFEATSLPYPTCPPSWKDRFG